METAKRSCFHVVCDSKTGRVLAASPKQLQVTGDDAPDEVRLVARDGQFCEEVELTREQLAMDPAKLFATHIVRKGRLVAKDVAD